MLNSFLAQMLKSPPIKTTNWLTLIDDKNKEPNRNVNVLKKWLYRLPEPRQQSAERPRGRINAREDLKMPRVLHIISRFSARTFRRLAEGIAEVITKITMHNQLLGQNYLCSQFSYYNLKFTLLLMLRIS